MRRNLIKIVALALYLPSFAYGSDLDVMNDIENALIFDKNDRLKIEELSPMRGKPALVIDRTKKKKKRETQGLGFKVYSGESLDLDMKKKERLAYSAYQNGQYEVAIELYKQIVRREPENEYAKYSLALIYQKMRQYDEAKALYRQLLRDEAPNREEIVANLLDIVAQDSPREAVYMLSRLVSQHPESAYLLAETGMIYEKLKDYDKAISYLERAVEKDSKRADYKYNLAVVYDKNKEYNRAIEAYYAVIRNYQSDRKWRDVISLDKVKSRIEELRAKG